jgi:hypothetical protein
MKFEGDLKSKKDTLKEVMKDVRIKKAATAEMLKQHNQRLMSAGNPSHLTRTHDLDP